MFEAGAQRIHQWTLYAPDGRGILVPIEWMADGHPHGIAITRARMDWILLERAREVGVETRERFLVSSRFQRTDGPGGRPGLGQVEGTADGETIERFTARIVIDASGRHSLFSSRNRDGGSRSARTAVPGAGAGSRSFGCKVHLRGVRGLAGAGELFFYRDGYGGVVEVEGERTNLCFSTSEATLRAAKGDREKLLELTIRSNPAARRRLQGAVIDGEWLGTGPIDYGWKHSIPGVLAIGDAGAFIDPFTGSGMMLALTSGELAAEVIAQAWTDGIDNVDQIANRYHRLHRANLGLRFRACALLRRFTIKPWPLNLFISLLARHQSLLKIVTLSTRRSRIG
jgi:flavin-dependent dehydrogenase